jgi:outer membrane protein assembly factor BamD
MSKLSALCLGLAVVLGGCASDAEKDQTLGWSPNRIYQEAQDERSAGNNEKAVALFEKLEGRAAGTPLAQQAMLDAAFLHFKAREPVQAIATLDRFIRLHPTSPAMDYALYLKGLVNFNDDAGLLGFLSPKDLSERDQKAAKDSFETFKELVTRFPTSKYAADARARMNYVVNSLAQSEVNVARYYLTRGAYLAAVARAQTAIQDYPQAPALEEALAILVQSYDALNLPKLRDDNKRVLQTNFPQSTYLNQGLTHESKSWWKLW